MHFIALLLVMTASALDQGGRPPSPAGPAPVPPQVGKPPVEKLSPTTYRIGNLQVDTGKREVVARGVLNDVQMLEFVANTRGGMKAYESAMTIETDAVSFNTALLLIGLDPKRARVPTRHFDPEPPQGDPVEMYVSWILPSGSKQARVEELLYDKRTGKTMPEGPWVYTGSTFVENGSNRRFMADLDGVLIGFVHSPSPIIENPRAGAVNGFGSIIINPNLGLPPGSPLTLTIRALPAPAVRR